MKYLFALILMTSMHCFGQDYKAQIATYRKGYMNDFLTDSSSPLKQDDLQFLRFYDADSNYRVKAKVELELNSSPFVIPAFSGNGKEYTRFAVLKFVLNGKPMQLSIYKSVSLSKLPQYSDYLFIPFTDDTNGNTTYGGGRYIDMRVGEIKNNTAILDFNKAYNPYCAFSGGYSCPKPPDENHLAIAVEAGEKIFAGGNKH